MAEIKKELEKLQAPVMKSLTPEERQAARSARTRAQNKSRRPLFEKVFGKSDPDAEILTAEELQQLLLEDGIKPEDKLGSRMIIEDRERLNK